MRRLFIVLLLAAGMVAWPARAAAQDQVMVYYAGPPSGASTLTLSPDLNLVEDISQADVIFLNNWLPDPAAVASQMAGGAGLVLVLGPELEASQVSKLLGVSIQLKEQQTPLSVTATKGRQDPVLEQIAWNSAPQVRDRYEVSSDQPFLVPLVVGFEDEVTILGQIDRGDVRGYVLSAVLDGANAPFQEWAYYNYLIYHLVVRAAGRAPVDFAHFAGSPVPHLKQQILLSAALGVLLLFASLLFWRVRRYSLAHPEALDRLVSNPLRYEARQAKTDWEAVGFHRPLGGFLLAFMLGLVLFIPLIIYQNFILPVYILPSAQALGIWGRVVQFFNFLWLLLDMGTSAAFIKYFAEYRVHNPRQAIQFGQVFVWWQILSGAVQVALVVALAGTLLPRTALALYTWSVILHTFVQIPGIYQLLRNGLMAWQRFDYAQILDLGLALIFPVITQPLIVGVMVVWGRANPVFGPAMGGLLGLGLSAYAAELLTFLVGLWLYRRLGYNTGLLFLAHFDWQVVRRAFRFGFFEMAGSVAWATGQAVEIFITQTRLVNYTEVWGNWVLAQNFIFAFNVLQTLYNNLMPAISEAITHARVALSQYYAAVAYKWGGMISAFIGAVLLAVADRFILGASGPEFVRAASYAFPLIIWGAIQYPSWVGDTVQLGANHPYLKAAMVGSEQVVRIVLAFLLLERLQINALIVAYFVGLLAKGLAAYFINNRLCYRQRFYFWQSLGAPLLAGAAHFAVLRLVTGLIWQGDQVSSILIFLLGILISYPMFAFFYGIFGGWDDASLAELEHATRLSSFMGPLARLFSMSTRWGARLSPLHNRFPITIRPAAMEEAAALTRERVNLLSSSIDQTYGIKPLPRP